MNDPTQRFSDRAEVYRKFRPSYSPEVFAVLERECGFASNSVVADIGAGTGLLTELLLKRGNPVLAVEPNQEMRTALGDMRAIHPRLTIFDGMAEATSLRKESVDLITAGTAFHWFAPGPTRREFQRILKPGGWVAILKNDRRLGPEPFLCEYESQLMRFGLDYVSVKQSYDPERERAFFAPGQCFEATFPNHQDFDLAGFEGRVSSASYMPLPGHPRYPALQAALKELFGRYQINGRVRVDYDCRICYGHLTD